MARVFRIFFIFLFFLVALPFEVVADESATPEQSTPEQLRHESVVKLKESLKREQRNLSVAGGITKWSADAPDDQPNAFTMLKGLAICIGLFFVGISVVQRLRNKTNIKNDSERRLKILEKISISNKTSLILAELDGRDIVFSVGSEKVSFCPEKNVVENKSLTSPNFADVYIEEGISA